MAAQFFKGDATEQKFADAFLWAFMPLTLAKTDFFENAYLANDLGGVLFDTKRAPLTNAIPRDVFKDLFAYIFSFFYQAGTAESYLTIFRAVFGNDVEVTLEVPGPGQLNIDIVAQGVALDLFVARTLAGSAYIFDEIVDQDDDNIVFRSIKGLNSQYEVETMLFELVPYGIFTQITLTLGG